MITKEKNIQKKSYKELYEIIKILSSAEKNKLPKELIGNIQNEMDKSHIFVYDFSKSISEQSIMPQTKALVVKIYEKYLAPEDKEKWLLYDKLCANEAELRKKRQYGKRRLLKKYSLEKHSKNDSKDFYLLSFFSNSNF